MTEKSPEKLKYLVEKLADQLGLQENNEKNVDVIYKNLILKNKEYQGKNSSSLKSLISTKVADYLANRVKISTSLNSSLSRAYNTSNASKRSRPDEHELEPEDLNASALDARSAGNLISKTEAVNENVNDTSQYKIQAKRVRVKKNENNIGANSRPESLISPKIEFRSDRPELRLSDLAGIGMILDKIKELIFFPVRLPKLYSDLGVHPPSGILLHGPSGCGKTSLAFAIAGELGLPFFKASGPELIGGISGESEGRIQDMFREAIENSPSVLFIDAIDVIAPKKEANQRGMDRRVVAQLYDCIDMVKTHGSSSNTLWRRIQNENNLSSDGNKGDYVSSDSVDGTSSEPNVNPEAKFSDLGVHNLNNSEVTMSKSNLVILIAATSRPDTLDAGLRGRFFQEIALPVPDAPARTKILKLFCKDLKLSNGIDFIDIGKATPGFVGADLRTLVSEAGSRAVKRIIESAIPAKNLVDDSTLNKAISNTSTNDSNKCATWILPSKQYNDSGVEEYNALEKKANDAASNMASSVFVFNQQSIMMSYGENCSSLESFNRQYRLTSGEESDISDKLSVEHESGLIGVPLESVIVEMHDFYDAIKTIQPTAKREGFAVAPNVKWEDIGALAAVREELLHNVLEPIAHPELFRSLGLEVPAGVLFFGPPGCGKTLLAKALANQSGANFISVKGPELLNMYVGESESRVRQVFDRARASAPCVIFFDELDALCPRRGSGAEGSSGVTERVVNQLLTELDGLEVRRDVYIIAATNRLELIDDAMLRPGRLGKLLYVPLPNADDRVSILEAVSRNVSVDRSNVNFDSLGRDVRAEGYSGADIAALVREAGMAVLQEWRANNSKNNNLDSNSLGEDLGKLQQSSTKTVDTKHDVVEVPQISQRHFEIAFSRVHPSVSSQDRARHDKVNYLIKNKGMAPLEALRMARNSSILDSEY